MTDVMDKLEKAVAGKPSTQPEVVPAEEPKTEEFIEDGSKMTEDEIDSAVESGDLKPEQAEGLKKQYGYAKKEDKKHIEKIEKSVKGNKGDLNAALHQARVKQDNLKNQMFYGQNKINDAQRALNSLEKEFSEETLTGAIQKKLNEASSALTDAKNELHLSKEKMHQSQVEMIVMDTENYPASAEIWKLAKERMELNSSEAEEAEKSGNLALTAYTIGMRSVKAQEVIAKFKAKARLSDKVTKNLEALKKRGNSPTTPGGPGAGKKIVRTPRLKELKDRLKTKTTEEDLAEAMIILEGKKP